MSFTYRNEKGSPLTYGELDENFQIVEDYHDATLKARDETFEAKDQATAARDAAVLAGNIYESIAQGLSNTSDGEYFSVALDGYNGIIDFYKNVTGTESFITRYRVIPKDVNSTPSIIADFVNQEFKLAGDYGLAETTFGSLFNFSRASSATRINHLLQVETRLTDEHRIQYDYTTGRAQGLLVESSVTNLALQSDNFFNAVWVKSALGTASAPLVTANVGIAPDGTLSADRIYFKLNGGTASGDLSSIQQTIANTPGDRREGFVWLKSNTGTDQKLKLTFSNNSSDLPDTDSFITVTTEWKPFRVGIASMVGTANSPRLSIRGSDTETEDECDILAWGYNCYDNFGGPTSDIATAASTVTRAIDSCTLLNGSDTLIDKGTIYLETFVPPDSVTAGGYRFFRLSDGTNNNRITLYKTTAGNISSFVVSGGNDTGVSLGNFDVGETLKIAIRYDKEGVTIYANGMSYSATFAPSLSVDLTEVDLGHEGSIAGNTPISLLEYYPSQLTDDEMRGKTS